MDKIILAAAEFYAYGGVTEAEKAVGQRYQATIEMELDLRRASQTDSLDDTVSYAHVFEVVVSTARERRFNLLESLSSRIADRLLETFPVARVTVQVRKLLPPIDGAVAYAAVELTRERVDYDHPIGESAHSL